MDSTDITQQQINDAASQINPNLSAANPPSEPPVAGPPSEAVPPLPGEVVTPQPPPAPEPPQPVVKKEAVLPPPLSPKEPSIPDVPPVQASSTTTFGPPPPSENAPTSSSAKRGVSKGFVVAIVFLLLATLPVAVYYVSQQQQQVAETRSKAAICAICGGGTCPNGLAYGPDNCSSVSCSQRVAQICGTVTPSPKPLPPEALQIVAGSISGKICRDKIKDSGAVYFFNIDRKTVQFIPVSATATTYSKKLIPGSYGVQFQSDTDQTPLGYTNPDHNLTLITLDVRQTVTNIDLCDTLSTGPGANFASEDAIVQ